MCISIPSTVGIGGGVAPEGGVRPPDDPFHSCEREIVDLAPWVPLFTPSHVFLTSKRVGNYQYNPESRLLFDQLWVR